MRVITGTAKGKPLKSLQGQDTRPTADSVKEAMFSAVQFDVKDSVVLDLFAGSGQLGIEALSRGAKQVYFTDNNAKAAAVIKENLEYTKLTENAKVSRLPYTAFLRMLKEDIDIAFIDPPYEKRIIEKALPLLVPKMSRSGVIICEHEKKLELPERIEEFTTDKIYRRGSVTVTIYRRADE